jgi:hypothetical protein
MKTSDKNLVGAAGENLVLSRLLSRGILASQAPRGTRKADILVNPLDGGSPLLIQVKTTLHTGGRAKWHMKEKHEGIADKDMFYCFVDLGEKDSDIFVIPAKVVSHTIKASYKAWLKTPGKKGQAHNETVMRWITSKYPWKVPGISDDWMEEYLEKWETLS